MSITIPLAMLSDSLLNREQSNYISVIGAILVIFGFIFVNINREMQSSINDYLNFNKGSILLKKKDIIYTFSSTGLHFGSLNGGHYVAICNTKDGNILYDDMNVSNIDNNINFKDKNTNAYMIVYTKKKNKK
jgi:ubiquitin C-terminal hydrolase